MSRRSDNYTDQFRYGLPEEDLNNNGNFMDDQYSNEQWDDGYNFANVNSDNFQNNAILFNDQYTEYIPQDGRGGYENIQIKRNFTHDVNDKNSYQEPILHETQTNSLNRNHQGNRRNNHVNTNCDNQYQMRHEQSSYYEDNQYPAEHSTSRQRPQQQNSAKVNNMKIAGHTWVAPAGPSSSRKISDSEPIKYTNSMKRHISVDPRNESDNFVASKAKVSLQYDRVSPVPHKRSTSKTVPNSYLGKSNKGKENVIKGVQSVPVDKASEQTQMAAQTNIVTKQVPVAQCDAKKINDSSSNLSSGKGKRIVKIYRPKKVLPKSQSTPTITNKKSTNLKPTIPVITETVEDAVSAQKIIPKKIEKSQNDETFLTKSESVSLKDQDKTVDIININSSRSKSETQNMPKTNSASISDSTPKSLLQKFLKAKESGQGSAEMGNSRQIISPNEKSVPSKHGSMSCPDPASLKKAPKTLTTSRNTNKLTEQEERSKKRIGPNQNEKSDLHVKKQKTTVRVIDNQSFDVALPPSHGLGHKQTKSISSAGSNQALAKGKQPIQSEHVPSTSTQNVSPKSNLPKEQPESDTWDSAAKTDFIPNFQTKPTYKTLQSPNLKSKKREAHQRFLAERPYQRPPAPYMPMVQQYAHPAPSVHYSPGPPPVVPAHSSPHPSPYPHPANPYPPPAQTQPSLPYNMQPEQYIMPPAIPQQAVPSHHQPAILQPVTPVVPVYAINPYRDLIQPQFPILTLPSTTEGENNNLELATPSEVDHETRKQSPAEICYISDDDEPEIPRKRVRKERPLKPKTHVGPEYLLQLVDRVDDMAKLKSASNIIREIIRVLPIKRGATITWVDKDTILHAMDEITEHFEDHFKLQIRRLVLKYGFQAISSSFVPDVTDTKCEIGDDAVAIQYKKSLGFSKSAAGDSDSGSDTENSQRLADGKYYSCWTTKENKYIMKMQRLTIKSRDSNGEPISFKGFKWGHKPLQLDSKSSVITLPEHRLPLHVYLSKSSPSVPPKRKHYKQGHADFVIARVKLTKPISGLASMPKHVCELEFYELNGNNLAVGRSSQHPKGFRRIPARLVDNHPLQPLVFSSNNQHCVRPRVSMTLDHD